MNTLGRGACDAFGESATHLRRAADRLSVDYLPCCTGSWPPLCDTIADALAWLHQQPARHLGEESCRPSDHTEAQRQLREERHQSEAREASTVEQRRDQFSIAVGDIRQVIEQPMGSVPTDGHVAASQGEASLSETESQGDPIMVGREEDMIYC